MVATAVTRLATELARVLISILRMARERLVHHRLQLGRPRDVALDLGERARTVREAHDHRLLRRRRLGKGSCPVSMLNATSAERVDVAAAVERVAGELLGRHVLRRADDEPRLRHLLHSSPWPPSRCRSRRPSRDRRRRVPRAIMMLSGLRSRCTIPMSCAASSALGHLPRDVRRALRRQRARLLDELRERLAVDELHREIDQPVRRLAEVVDRRDVRVLDPARVRRLAIEAARSASASCTMPGCITFIALLRAHLHVLGEIHLPHAAFAELAEHVVAVGDDRADEVAARLARAASSRRAGRSAARSRTCCRTADRSWRGRSRALRGSRGRHRTTVTRMDTASGRR